MTDSITFKAGDTFSFGAEIAQAYLDINKTWGARAWVRDLESETRPPTKIDELTCTLTAPTVPADPYALLLFKDGGASGTGLWPRPTDPRKTRKLLVDVEFYDNSATSVVHSTSSFYILIEFDPTRPA